MMDVNLQCEHIILRLNFSDHLHLSAVFPPEDPSTYCGIKIMHKEGKGRSQKGTNLWE